MVRAAEEPFSGNGTLAQRHIPVSAPVFQRMDFSAAIAEQDQVSRKKSSRHRVLLQLSGTTSNVPVVSQHSFDFHEAPQGLYGLQDMILERLPVDLRGLCASNFLKNHYLFLFLLLSPESR